MQRGGKFTMWLVTPNKWQKKKRLLSIIWNDCHHVGKEHSALLVFEIRNKLFGIQMFIVENWFRQYFVRNFTNLGIKEKRKQLPIRGTPKEGWEGVERVQRKDSFNEYFINKNGLLSAMLFLLRDGFLSSIGQQNVLVTYEHRSIWLHPQDPALYFSTVAWMRTAGSPLLVSRAAFFIKVPPTPNKSESYVRRKTM